MIFKKLYLIKDIYLMGSMSLALLLVSNASYAQGTHSSNWGWLLPHEISDSNTKVGFEVDSTWHVVRGVTSGITGRVWQRDPSDPLSISAFINLPVEQFTTDGEMRDEKMKKVMHIEQAPNVVVAIDGILPACSVDVFKIEKHCDAEVHAKLNIAKVERPMKLKGKLVKEGDIVRFYGDVKFLWADFGVDDPSILIAKLDPEVSVYFSVAIPSAPVI